MANLEEYRCIWIVGASSGIGLSLAEALSTPGRTLYLSARSEDKLSELATELSSNVVSLPLDVGSEEQVANAIEKINEQPKGLDAVIVNAGTCEYVDGPNIDTALVDRVMRTNFYGAVNVINQALPLLRKAKKAGKRPKLVVMSSSVTYQPLPRAHAYGASKAALRYFTECLKIDLDREGIDVQLVSPGFVKTPLTDKNDFPMPFRISSERAAQEILKGMSQNTYDIHFPSRFTWMLKFMANLPSSLRFKLLARMARDSETSPQVSGKLSKGSQIKGRDV